MNNKTAIAALALSTAAFIGGTAEARDAYSTRIARLERQVVTLQRGVTDAKNQALTARLLSDKLNCIKYVLPVHGVQSSPTDPTHIVYSSKNEAGSTYLVAFDPDRPGCVAK